VAGLGWWGDLVVSPLSLPPRVFVLRYRRQGRRRLRRRPVVREESGPRFAYFGPDSSLPSGCPSL